VVDLKDLDPSLCFGFLVNSYDQYLDLIEEIQRVNVELPEEKRVLTI
jgi:hypothetical protein